MSTKKRGTKKAGNKITPLPPNVVPFPAGRKTVPKDETPKRDDCARLLAIGRLIDELQSDQVRGFVRAGWRKAGIALFAVPMGMCLVDEGGDDESA